VWWVIYLLWKFYEYSPITSEVTLFTNRQAHVQAIDGQKSTALKAAMITINMSVLLIVGPKCTLAASHALVPSESL